jgi:long-chain fatty acid transport protein
MKRLLLVTAAGLAFLLSAVDARAAGFRLLEQDNAGQGMAHATAAGVADAAAVYYNPAAMTEIGAYAAKIGGQVVDPQTDYTGRTASLSTANTSFAIPHAYMVKSMPESGLAFGFGAFSNFGTGTTWSDNGPFRYVATDTQLATLTLSFNAAKKINDTLSVAAGLDYLTAHSSYNSMYPWAFFEPGAADGYQVMSGSGSGVGFNVAVLAKPTDDLKVGLTYRSGMTVKLEGDLEVQNFPGTVAPLIGGSAGADYKSTASVELPLPGVLVFGVSYRATERLRVEVDIDHTFWSAYDQLEFNIDSPLAIPGAGVSILPSKSVVEKKWKDVTALRIGAAYDYSAQTTLRAGYYFDPNPTPDDTFEPRLPDTDRSLVAFGVGYKATDNFTLDAAYSYLWSQARTVDNDVGATTRSSVDGDYKTSAHIFGVSFGVVF